METAGPEPILGFHKFLISDRSIRTRVVAITAILDRLVEIGSLEATHRHGVLEALLRREELGSTAIGCGVAVPHATYPGIGSTLGAIARFPAGVDFDSLDGERVRLVCLLVSPTGRPGEHLRLLETVARNLRQQGA
jgi:mannitol/fructose-specific phosphotransferase system IIA component (Ntr-type)